MTQTDEFLREVHLGLSAPQKTLHPKWLYDDRGSQLFEQITGVPEYYLTRTEALIFDTALPDLAEIFMGDVAIAEYGSGASVKTRRLLDAVTPSVYVPIDIASDFLEAAANQLSRDYPEISVHPTVGDFTQPITLPDAFQKRSTRMGFFPGSTIGNMDGPEAVSFLARAQESLGPNAYFLVGADLIKDTATLEAAYDDAQGVTAAFNLNLLTRINRELGANFNPDAFQHRAVFNEDASRIEMHLVSRKEQIVTLDVAKYAFRAGETIHTESSYKFTPDSIANLGQQAGWHLDRTWTDPKGWFGLFLFAAR